MDIDIDDAPEGGNEFPAEKLFAAASTAVLLADAATHRVVAVNPAALLLLGLGRPDLLGCDWRTAFSTPDPIALETCARQAAAADPAVRVAVSSRAGGTRLGATISSFRVSAEAYLLIRLAGHDDNVPAAQATQGFFSAELSETLHAIPTAFVVTDAALCIEFANRAFARLADAWNGDALEGLPLLRWLALDEVQLGRMRQQMASRQATLVLTTTFGSAPGAARVVEVTVVAVPDPARPHWGFMLRTLGGVSKPSLTKRLDG